MMTTSSIMGCPVRFSNAAAVRDVAAYTPKRPACCRPTTRNRPPRMDGGHRHVLTPARIGGLAEYHERPLNRVRRVLRSPAVRAAAARVDDDLEPVVRVTFGPEFGLFGRVIVVGIQDNQRCVPSRSEPSPVHMPGRQSPSPGDIPGKASRAADGMRPVAASRSRLRCRLPSYPWRGARSGTRLLAIASPAPLSRPGSPSDRPAASPPPWGRTPHRPWR